jgi:hypothetical protein
MQNNGEPEKYYRGGYQLYQQEEYELALSYFEKAARRSAQDTYYNAVGNCLWAMDKFKRR